MTLPKGWKKEQPTTKKENSSEQKEQSRPKIEQTSSTITIEDKIIIRELQIAQHNIALDNKSIDEWTQHLDRRWSMEHTFW